MKVCTDACIFGAFIAQHLGKKAEPILNILDIGAGTGLLSLMLAQKTPGYIEAIEIEENAYNQATQNIAQSICRSRIKILNEDALKFVSQKKYDCIISNPPFFEGDLQSVNAAKNAAKHDTTLTLENLLITIKKNIADNGCFAILLPYHRVAYFIELAQLNKYYLNEKLLIRHTIEHPFFRGILIFSNRASTIKSNELVIKNASGNYSEPFVNLLQDYYLHL